MKRPSSISRGRAFLTADAVLALAIVGILAAALAATLNRHHKASQRLAEARADVRLAEEVLLAMQSGEKVPSAPQGVKIDLNLLDRRDAPDGCAWVRVGIARGPRMTELVGLVRADALKGASP